MQRHLLSLVLITIAATPAFGATWLQSVFYSSLDGSQATMTANSLATMTALAQFEKPNFFTFDLRIRAHKENGGGCGSVKYIVEAEQTALAMNKVGDDVSLDIQAVVGCPIAANSSYTAWSKAVMTRPGSLPILQKEKTSQCECPICFLGVGVTLNSRADG